MRLHINFRNPTPSHCDVAVFVNGALAGVLTLRQEELFDFQDIVFNGQGEYHQVRSDGNPNPREEKE